MLKSGKKFLKNKFHPDGTGQFYDRINFVFLCNQVFKTKIRGSSLTKIESRFINKIALKMALHYQPRNSILKQQIRLHLAQMNHPLCTGFSAVVAQQQL